jgi:hypothetical protein
MYIHIEVDSFNKIWQAGPIFGHNLTHNKVIICGDKRYMGGLNKLIINKEPFWILRRDVHSFVAFLRLDTNVTEILRGVN